jgi:hypothetical protein
MQPLYKIGQKVRCVSDDNYNIEPGTILTVNSICLFNNSKVLSSDESATIIFLK